MDRVSGYYWIAGSLVFLLPVVEYILESVIRVLNRWQWGKAEHHPTVEQLYSSRDFTRAREYSLDRSLPASLESFFQILLLLFLLGSGWVGALDAMLRELLPWGNFPPVHLPIFLGILMLPFSLVSLPFDYFQVFHIDERFGFNRSSRRTFYLDRVRGLLLAVLLGGPVLAILGYLLSVAGPLAWFFSWLILALFQLLLGLFASHWILPLFNKLTPLADGPLKRRLENLAHRSGFPVGSLYLMDGSRRSSRANAFFTGYGKYRRIVLYDTLVEKCTLDEIEAILAHEIGHARKRHALKHILLSIAYTGFLLGLLFYFVRSPFASRILQSPNGSLSSGVFLSGVLFSPVSYLYGVLSSWLSRKAEFQADAFAREAMGSGRYLAKALKHISVDVLSHPLPHPLAVFLTYSHPPVLERLRALEKENPVLSAGGEARAGNA